MKLPVTLALALLLAAPLAAQTVPAGWKYREDRSTSATDPDGAGAIKILTAGTGYHIETPTAAVFWNPANTVTGNYTLKATFTQNERSGHVNFYGLVLGGKNLDAADQSYTYFLIAQDNPPGARFGAPQPLGSWLIKTRKGDVTSPAFTIPGAAGRSGTMAHNAVKVPDASGKAVNTLEVRVQAAKVDFVINGTVIHSAARAEIVTDGLWGIRSNHLLNINVDNLSVTQQ
jgi:hypothetical protein